MKSFSLFRKPRTGIAIEFSQGYVQVLALDAQSGVSSYVLEQLPEQVIVGAEIKDRDVLREALLKAFAHAKPWSVDRFHRHNVNFVLPVSSLPIHAVWVERRTSVEVQMALLQEIPDFDLGMYYFGYRYGQKNAQGKTEVFVTYVLKELLRSYAELLRSVDLEPESAELSSEALARSSNISSSGCALLLNIESRSSTLSIFEEGLLVSTRLISFGRMDCVTALMERLEVDETEAVALMERDGFDRNILDNRVLVILQEKIQQLIIETKKLRTEIESSRATQVNQCYLRGELGYVPFLDEYVALNLALPVSFGSPLVHIQGGYEVLDTTAPEKLALVIGLALKDLSKSPSQKFVGILEQCKHDMGDVTPKSFTIQNTRILMLCVGFSLVVLLYVVFSTMVRPYLRFVEVLNSRVGITKVVYHQDEENSTEYSAIPLDSVATTSTILEATSSSLSQFNNPGMTLLQNQASTSKVGLRIDPPIALEGNQLLPHIRIRETPTGWLKVRMGPGKHHEEITKVHPQEIYLVLGHEGDWTKIEYAPQAMGYVLSAYTDKILLP